MLHRWGMEKLGYGEVDASSRRVSAVTARASSPRFSRSLALSLSRSLSPLLA